jgi:hypothetical protein
VAGIAVTTKTTRSPVRWRVLKKTNARRLRCINCDSIAMEVRAEPVKRNTRELGDNQFRISALCLSCRQFIVISDMGPAS